MAAIYLRSKEVKGANFVSYNGVSYRRTGVFKKLSSTTTTPVSDVDLFYVNSCSAADYGQKGLINGGTLSVPASATEFQLKFDGNNPGDEGILILGDAPNTCNVTLSVNSGGNLVFDPLSSGDPGGFEFITYPTTLNYTDCNSTVWNITLAAKGSFYLTFATSSPAAGGGGGGGGSGDWSAAHSFGLSGNNPQQRDPATVGGNHIVDACFSASCPAWHDNVHHYHSVLYNGGWGADIYGACPLTPGSTGYVTFTLSLLDRNNAYPAFNREAMEAATGSTVCADCVGLSAHTFQMSGIDATGSLYRKSGDTSAAIGPTWAIPCARCGGSNNALSLTLAITSSHSAGAPIDWATGLDSAGDQALFDINFTGVDGRFTLGKYVPPAAGGSSGGSSGIGSTPAIQFFGTNSGGYYELSANYTGGPTSGNIYTHPTSPCCPIVPVLSAGTGTGPVVNLQPGKVYTIYNNQHNTADHLRITSTRGVYDDAAYNLLDLDQGPSAWNDPNPVRNSGTLDVDAITTAAGNVPVSGEWYFQHGGNYGNSIGAKGFINFMTVGPGHANWPSSGNQI